MFHSQGLCSFALPYKMQHELSAAVKEQGRSETRPKEKEETLFPQLRAERNQAVFQRDAVLANTEQY